MATILRPEPTVPVKAILETGNWSIFRHIRRRTAVIRSMGVLYKCIHLDVKIAYCLA